MQIDIGAYIAFNYGVGDGRVAQVVSYYKYMEHANTTPSGNPNNATFFKYLKARWAKNVHGYGWDYDESVRQVWLLK